MAAKKPKKVIRAYQENLVFFLGETFVWRYGADGIFGDEAVEATNAMNRALDFPEEPFPSERLVRWMNLQVGAPKDVPFNKLRNAIIQQMEESGEAPPALEPEPEPTDLYGPPVEKKGWPWWVWALIGLGAVSTVSGGVYLYYRYGKRRRRGLSDYGDTDGCDYAGLSEPDESVETDSAGELPSRSITWGEK